MKNVKIFILVVSASLLSANVYSQEKETSFFENTSAAGPGNSGGGTTTEDPDPGAAPINDYLPLLVIGAGLVALRYRKQLLKN